MAKQTKAKAPQRAKPLFKSPRATDAQKVALTQSQATAIKASPDWNSAPQVQAVVGTWTTAATAVAQNAAAVAGLVDQLKTLRLSHRVLLQQWAAQTKQVLSVIDVFCDGDVAKLHGFGFDAAVRNAPSALAVPTDLITHPGKLSGQAVVAWKIVGPRDHGFLVQHATDAANPATYSTPIASTKRKFTLIGAQPASVVHFRVAAIDPSSATGQTAWSDWVSATAR